MLWIRWSETQQLDPTHAFDCQVGFHYGLRGFKENRSQKLSVKVGIFSWCRSTQPTGWSRNLLAFFQNNYICLWGRRWKNERAEGWWAVRTLQDKLPSARKKIILAILLVGSRVFVLLQ